jgi:hypothetical protein
MCANLSRNHGPCHDRSLCRPDHGRHRDGTPRRDPWPGSGSRARGVGERSCGEPSSSEQKGRLPASGRRRRGRAPRQARVGTTTPSGRGHRNYRLLPRVTVLMVSSCGFGARRPQLCDTPTKPATDFPRVQPSRPASPTSVPRESNAPAPRVQRPCPASPTLPPGGTVRRRGAGCWTRGSWGRTYTDRASDSPGPSVGLAGAERWTRRGRALDSRELGVGLAGAGGWTRAGWGLDSRVSRRGSGPGRPPPRAARPRGT